MTAPRTRQAELSFAQQRLFAEEQLFHTQALYTVSSGVRLHGPLNLDALRTALRSLTDRHEMLRSSFHWVAGEAVVRTAEPGPAPELRHEDLRQEHLRATDARRLAYRRLDDAQRRPFDLADAPLWRVLVLGVGDDEHWMLLTLHHIVIDGWSIGLLWQELTEAYDAAAHGRAPRFAAPAMTYTEYARRQRAELTGTRLDELLGYWRDQLAGCPAELPLPLDRPRPVVRGYEGAAHRFPLPRSLATGARKLAERNRTTLFVALFAVFARLMSRYGGTEDVVIGVPMANRNRPETAGLIGMLVNPMPLRMRMRPGLSVDELVALARKVTLGAMVHQDLPFERLVSDVAPRRDTGAHPLFQVQFAVEVLAASAVTFPGMTASELDTPDGPTSGADLSVTFHEAGDDLTGFIEYRKDLWDASTIERLAEHFRVMLGAAVVPGARVADLPCVSPAEHRDLTGPLASGGPPAPPALVHELVEDVAGRVPDAIAVTDGHTQLRYAELDARANVVATALRRHGSGPERLVAVCLPRGPEMVAAWLGVLKSGAGYVPLDPSYPDGRLQQIVRDAAPVVVLTVSAWRERFEQAEVVCLEELAGTPGDRPDVRVHPDNIAYVTYTSGSTGRPKGVLITHRALGAFARTGMLAPAPTDTVGMHTSVAFDMSAYEVWNTLCAGARIRTAPPKDRLDPADYLALAAESSLLFLTPGLFAVLTDHDPETLAKLRWLIIGADRMDGDRIFQHRDRDALVTSSTYGPAECTVIATGGPALRRAPSGQVPIGRPLPGVRAYVLDNTLRPLPTGVIGELYLGGTGLARGYLRSPARTAERFVADPFTAGERLYRTGDLVRRLADGALEFIGRGDDQVKLRGFRIEPGEIAAVTREHDQVADAVVALRQDRLIGYVVPAGELDQAALLDFLRDRLPSHMVPSAIVELSALPLTPSGKVDRAALPAPAPAADVSHQDAVTPAQRLVMAAFCEVLNVSDIGMDENFFDAGGDSLLAMRVVGRLADDGGEISVVELYRRGTVRSCAAYLEDKLEGTVSS